MTRGRRRTVTKKERRREVSHRLRNSSCSIRLEQWKRETRITRSSTSDWFLIRSLWKKNKKDEENNERQFISVCACPISMCAVFPWLAGRCARKGTCSNGFVCRSHHVILAAEWRVVYRTRPRLRRPARLSACCEREAIEVPSMRVRMRNVLQCGGGQ